MRLPLNGEFAKVLRDYLQSDDEADLYRASQLGHKLVEQGIGPDQLVTAHLHGLQACLGDLPPAEIPRAVFKAHHLLLEAVMAYGLAYREHVLAEQRRYDQIRRYSEQLAVQEQELRAIVESIADGLVLVDRAGRVRLTNRSGLALLSSEAREGHGYRLPSDDLPFADSRLRDILGRLDTLPDDRIEWEVEREERAWHVGVAPARIAVTGDLGAVVVARDITAQRQAEQERVARATAEAAQRRSAFLAEVSAALHSSLDVDRIIQGMTRLMVPILADDCVVTLVESDSALEDSESRPISTFGSANRDLAILVAKLVADGRLHHSHSPLLARVLQTGRAVLFSEVSPLSLEEITSNAGHLASLQRLDVRSLMVVPLRDREQTLGVIWFLSRSADRRFTPEDLAFATEIAERATLAIANARLYRAAEERARENLALYNAARALAVAHAREMEERRQLEDQLRQAQKMEAIGLLAGGVAHDFNNLLSVILGFGEILRDGGELRGDDREAVEQIILAGEQAGMLTRQLLAFSRRQMIALKPIDLNLIVGQLTKLLRRLIGEDIALSVQLAPSLGTVKADPGQIEQILMNLGANARDAMPHGGTLAIKTANIELDADSARHLPDLKPGPYVTLTVADTGMGMDRETQARIFEPFFTTKEVGKGTGMGLAAVYGIVRQSGGAITVETALGQGTTFCVYLPRQDTSEASEPVTFDDPRVMRGTETVLVVEDSAPLRVLLRKTLESHGYTVLVAEDGRRALQIANTYVGVIDLLLTDIVMPGLSGRQVAEELVARAPRLKVLYMSGYTDDVIVRHGIEQSRANFLPKPFTPSRLAALVRQALDAPSPD